MSRITDEMYETAKDLYDCGVIDDRQMLECETRYRAHCAAEAAELAAAESAERSSGKPGRLQAAQA